MNVFIIGSCVTRDAFAFIPNQHHLVEYVARSSFGCSYHPSRFPKDIAELDSDNRITSAFQKRMVEYDISRALPNMLEAAADRIDVVIVDFIDERFQLVLAEGEIPATYSVALQECVASQDFEIVRSATDRHFDFWRQGFDRFMGQMRSLGLPVWINAVSWVGRTRQAEVYSAASLAKPNAYLDRLYAHAWQKGCRLVDGPTDPFIDPEHKWGLSPFHYEQPCYETLMSALNAAE